jgi:hypothetical protein
MRSLLRFIGCLFILLILVGCGGNTSQRIQDRILGKWRMVQILDDQNREVPLHPHSEGSQIYEYFADGTFTMGSERMAWYESPIHGTYTLSDNGQMRSRAVFVDWTLSEVSIEGDRLFNKGADGYIIIFQRER